MGSQREGNRGRGGLGGPQAPKGSLPVHRPRNSTCQSPAQLPDLPPPLTPQHQETPGPGGHRTSCPPPLSTQPEIPKPAGPSAVHLGTGVLSLPRDGSKDGGGAQRNLQVRDPPSGDHFPPAEGWGYGPPGIREMRLLMSNARSPAPTQWVLPFALALPNLPPRSTAPSPGRGGRPSLPGPPVSPPQKWG